MLQAFRDRCGPVATDPGRLGDDYAGLALVLLGVLIAMAGSSYDLPYFTNIDEKLYTDLAISMLQRGSINPKWFGHPGTLTIYLLAVWYGLLGLLAVLSGFVGKFQDFVALYYDDPSIMLFGGRLITMAFFGGSLAFAYKVAASVAGRNAGRIACVLFALSAQVVDHARLVRPDLQLVFFVLAGAYFSIAISRGGETRSYIAAGVMLGLGAVTRLPAIFLVVPIVCAHLLLHGSLRASLQDSRRLLAGALAALIAAFVTAPLLFFKVRKVLADLGNSDEAYHAGATSGGYLDALGFYADALKIELGWPVAAVALLALLLAWREKEVVVIACFPLAYLATICGLNLRWLRWIVPVVPFLAILAAIALARGAKLVALRYRRLGAAALVGSVLAAGAVPASKLLARQGDFYKDSAARGASEWIRLNVPQKATVLVEYDTVQLPADAFTLVEVGRDGRLKPVDTRSRTDFVYSTATTGKLHDVSDLMSVDFVVIGKLVNRFEAERTRHEKELSVYRYIRSKLDLVAEISAKSNVFRGGPILVFKVRK